MSDNHKSKATSPITAELNSILKDSAGNYLCSREEIGKLADQTQLVLFLYAISGRAYIQDTTAYWFVHWKFQGCINSYIGGLTKAAFFKYKCPEVEEAAVYHREHFIPKAK